MRRQSNDEDLRLNVLSFGNFSTPRRMFFVVTLLLGSSSCIFRPADGFSTRTPSLPSFHRDNNHHFRTSLTRPTRLSMAATTSSSSDRNNVSKKEADNKSTQTAASTADATTSAPKVASASSKSPEVDERVASYPWSDAQDWALRDNLPKYVIKIPRTAKNDSKVTIATYALWRSLLQDVPELAGYPVDVLQARYQLQQQEHSTTASSSDDSTTAVGILPFLQDYEFSAQGGVCGTVYGLEGVADGSRIETSAVANVQETLPMGYIQTSDKSALFEMGRPLTVGKDENVDSPWKVLPGATASAAQQLAANAAGAVSDNKALVSGGVTEADGYLVRLGAVTGIVLAGATAVNMMAHHMTVNVFWV